MSRSFTITGARLVGKQVGLRCLDGLISELGPDVTPHPGDETLVADGGELVPPLVNGHTHAAMTLLRGHGDDLSLQRWLAEAVGPIEERLTREDVYWGARLACLEMIAGGTTRFWDMYWHPGAAAEAVRDAGLNATLGAPLVDMGSGSRERRAATVEALDEITGCNPRVAPALAPHAVYSVSRESLRWVGELAAERELPVHVHVSETDQEVRDCLRDHGRRPVAYLDELGLLGRHTVLAHAVWLDDAERSLIAERGATVVTNPTANLKLGTGGIFDYPAARRVGIPIGLGTDGPGTNNALDMVAEMKLFSLVQKHRAADPATVSAHDAWTLGTGGHTPLLGAGHPIAVGRPADFLVLRRDASELGFGDLAAGVVYSGTGAVVDSVFVGGTMLMHRRRIPGADEVVEEARRRAQGLGLHRRIRLPRPQ